MDTKTKTPCGQLRDLGLVDRCATRALVDKCPIHAPICGQVRDPQPPCGQVRDPRPPFVDKRAVKDHIIGPFGNPYPH